MAEPGQRRRWGAPPDTLEAFDEPRSRAPYVFGVLAVVVVVVGAALALADREGESPGSVRRVDLADGPTAGGSKAEPSLDEKSFDEPFNVLVVGSDERPEGEDDGVSGRRSDTLAIVRMNPPARSLEVLAVPRDLWVPIADTGRKAKVNSAYNSGGPSRLVRTVSEALGVPIHRYVEIDFRGFRALVDLVGGVPVPFDGEMRDRRSGFRSPAGLAQLDGNQALLYVRSRHLEVKRNGSWRAEAQGDLDRVRRQQDLVRRIVGVLQERTKRDPGAIDELLRVMGPYLSVDRGFPAVELVGLADIYIDADPSAIPMAVLPTTPGGAAGQSILRLREAEAEPLLARFRTP
ncbi:MAG TPA: LCP family protein [Acidimicrobiales bacterium]